MVPSVLRRIGDQHLADDRAAINLDLGCRCATILAALPAGRRGNPAADDPWLHQLFLLDVSREGSRPGVLPVMAEQAVAQSPAAGNTGIWNDVASMNWWELRPFAGLGGVPP